MKKIIKKIIKILVTLAVFILIASAVIFYFFPSSFVDFCISYDKESIWMKISPIMFSQKILDTSSESDDLSWSPDEKHLAYTDFVREVIYDKEYFIKIIDPRAFQVRTVFIGDYHTSHYRWLDNNTIRVYVSAGSGVRVYRDVDIHLKEPFVAVNHFDPRYWETQAWGEYDD